MDEIVKRLMAEVDHDANEPLDILLCNAADEIECLRDEISGAMDMLKDFPGDDLQDRVERLINSHLEALANG